MTFGAGARLGPYEVLAHIGSGGMGEVYRARDTRLDRLVAIKVLRAGLASSPEHRSRFEREARAVAALNHPHICTLHDISRHPSTDAEQAIDFLVMEFAEGEVLADRLAKGPLPPDQVLRHAIEIADALDAAHRRGIVHRDLKPGNIMLTRSGVKLLDFGLAKMLLAGTGAPPTLDGGVAGSPTHTRPLTAEGTILGTLQYMAPEQLEGREVDARADIFTFGTIVHEMATGRKAFEARSQASLIAAILDSEPPPISSLQPLTPPLLDHIVRKCLEKDPENRWQSARDLVSELRWMAREGASGATPGVPTAGGRAVRRPPGWALAGAGVLLVAAGAAGGVALFGSAPARGPAIVFRVDPPPDAVFSSGGGSAAMVELALSPDGRRLVFAATRAKRRPMLYLRSLDSLDVQPLAGTENGSFPFWSPDGRSIGFFTSNKLKTLSLGGGTPQALADVTIPRGGSWSRDGTILFVPNTGGAVYRVSQSGGPVSAATTLAQDEEDHRFPMILPDGRRFLVFVLTSRPEQSGIDLASLDSPRRTRLVSTLGSASAAQGHLLFLREGTLLAQKLDAAGARLEGEPFRVADNVWYGSPPGFGGFSTSANGTLAFASGTAANQQPIWFDMQGRQLGAVGAPGDYRSLRLSPDDSQIAVQRSAVPGDLGDIWVIDLRRNTESRLTSDPATDAQPQWSPDGQRILFRSDRGGPGDFYQTLANGAGEEELVVKDQMEKFPSDWSADGRLIVFHRPAPNTGWDLWLLPLDGDRKPVPYLEAERNQVQGRLSPDGRFMAYASDESGVFEVYVQTVPRSAAKWQISSGGGSEPEWARDGRTLFYLSAERALMAADVKLAPTFDAALSRPILETRAAPLYAPFNMTYAVARDGRRVLINTRLDAASGSPLVVMLDWRATRSR